MANDNEFDDLNEDFEPLEAEGMPDPTAAAPEAEPEPEEVEQPAKGKRKRKKKEKKPKEKKPRVKKERVKTEGALMAKLARADLFTVMLAVSLGAILVAILCLVLEWGTYEYNKTPKLSAVPHASVSVTEPHVTA